MSDQLKSIGFTALVALVCSLLLTGAATGLKERKMRNVAVDRQKNILMSVGLVDPGGPATVERIEQAGSRTQCCYQDKVDGCP